MDIEDFKHSQTNITGFRMVNPNSVRVQSFMGDFRKYRLNRRYRTKPIIDVSYENISKSSEACIC